VIEAKDFSQRDKFPGLTGNIFDIALHRAMDLEKIPAIVFTPLLIGITFGGYWINGLNCLYLAVFFFFDWVSVSALPRYKRSFGPVKPQVLLLALARLIPVLFTPPSIWIPLQIMGCLLQLYAFWIEPYQIKINNQILETDKIPAASHFRVMHIGDLHLERHSVREDRLNSVIRDLSPDAILFSGDYLCLSSIRDRDAWNDLQNVLKEWHAPLGVYGVTGSPAVDLPENFPEVLKDTPVQLLVDKTAMLAKDGVSLQIIGLECTHKPHEDAPRLQKLMTNLNPGFRILLHHSPDLAPHVQNMDIDLQLSGHTHGGQVCLPLIGPLFTGSLYGLTFKSGRYLLQHLTLFITRGLGLEGLSAPRVRFLCPPEVVMWDITGKTTR
jgi:uncharacterized protein